MWPGGNGAFKAGGMMCYVVECVTLLTVNIVALVCSYCVIEAVDEGTS